LFRENREFYQERVAETEDIITAEVVEKPIKSVSGKVVKKKKTLKVERKEKPKPAKKSRTKDQIMLKVLTDPKLTVQAKVDQLLEKKSKFFIYNVHDNEYGGVQAYIVFVDKPDTIFGAWIYKLGGDDNNYSLRSFCKSGPPEEKRAEFTKIMRSIIERGEIKFSL
jgi:hypothetical protein